MSKEEFLEELERKLHVLNEQERRDVLEDYAQHIDLKIKNGQTEEEAVRSLGDPGELAAELLDVYHINSEYASDFHTEGNAGEGLQGGQEGPVQKAGRKTGLTGKLREKLAVSLAAGREQRGQRKAVRMQKSEERRLKRKAKMEIRKERKRMDGKQKEYRSERNIVSRALTSCANLTWTCILFCWKGVLFLTALPVMLLGAACLFLGGMVLVLLLQGYPLMGIGIMTVGMTMSSFGLTALLLSWVFTGKKNRQVKAEISGTKADADRGEETAVPQSVHESRTLDVPQD